MADPFFPGIPPSHLKALRILLAGLKGSQVLWALTGSLGFALQGVPVPVNDIDIQTDHEGAYAIERIFSANSTRPVVFSEKERIRSYYGALEMAGAEVEIMGELQKRQDNQLWEDPVDIARYRTWVTVEGQRVPVMDLEYEYHAYLRMGRLERAELLRKWLVEHPLYG